MGWFSTPSEDKAARDTAEHNAGQQQGSEASLLDLAVHSAVGCIFQSDAFNAGYSNGIANPSKK